ELTHARLLREVGVDDDAVVAVAMHVAEFAQCDGARVPLGRAARDQFVDARLEVKAQLVVDRARRIAGRGAKESAKAGWADHVRWTAVWITRVAARRRRPACSDPTQR